MEKLSNNITRDSNYPARRFIISAKQLNLTTNKRWVEKLLNSDRFCYRRSYDGNIHSVGSDSYKQTIKNQLFEMMDIFQRKYNNDWDLEFFPYFHNGKWRYEIYFQIRYKQIEITNSRKHSRILNELIVMFPFRFSSDYGCSYLGDPCGLRYSLQQDEWCSGYFHSHLPGTNRMNSFSSVTQTNEFCLGTGEISELLMELATEYDPERIELLLYVVDGYVQWESLEGGPHRVMAKTTIENDELEVNPSQSDMRVLNNRLLYYLHNNHQSLPFDFTYNNNVFKVINNKKLDDFVKNIFTNTYLRDYFKHVICKKGNNGRYFTYDRNIIENNSPIQAIRSIKNTYGELPFIYIQGERIDYQITNIQNTDMPDISEFIVYPKFLNYVSRELEHKIYKACVRGSGINFIHNSRNYVRRHITQD